MHWHLVISSVMHSALSDCVVLVQFVLVGHAADNTGISICHIAHVADHDAKLNVRANPHSTVVLFRWGLVSKHSSVVSATYCIPCVACACTWQVAPDSRALAASC